MMTSDRQTLHTDAMRELKHQLRTPINHIIGYSELMIEAAEDLGEQGTAESFRGIQRRGQTLTRQIEQLLPIDHEKVTEADLERLRTSFYPILKAILATPLPRSNASESIYAQDLHRVHMAAESLLCFTGNHHLAGGKTKTTPLEGMAQTVPPGEAVSGEQHSEVYR